MSSWTTSKSTASLPTWHFQRGNRLIFAVLLTEFDVKEFEAGAYQAG